MIIVSGMEVKRTVFPNGESHFDIEGLKERIKGKKTGIKITVKYENDSDIFGLIGVVAQIREYRKDIKMILDIPYLPYSRMDRGRGTKMETLKVLAGIINSLDFQEVRVSEVHSEVSEQLINNIKVRNTTKELYEAYIEQSLGGNTEGVYVVYPDKGAKDRYSKQIKTDKVIEIAKKRDFETGKLLGMEIVTPKEGYKDCKTAIIVDDLCSRGGTFNWATDLLAAEGITDVVLIVSHLEETILDGELYKHPNITSIIALDTMLDWETSDKLILKSGGKIEILRRMV